jgi:hypothetical protein
MSDIDDEDDMTVLDNYDEDDLVFNLSDVNSLEKIIKELGELVKKDAMKLRP